MSHRIVTIGSVRAFDWKAAGYLTSIFSVFLLGAIAWLKENPPWWYYPVLVAGMTTSILGMAFRYKSHLDEQREIHKAEAEAERRPARHSASRRTRSAAW